MDEFEQGLRKKIYDWEEFYNESVNGD